MPWLFESPLTVITRPESPSIEAAGCRIDLSEITSDIGVPVLKFRPKSPGVVSTSMCQKRSGFERSKVSRIGQTIVAGSATPLEDYEAAGLAFANGVYTGSIDIAGGAAGATLTIDILADTLVEGSETFAVNITSVSGAGATVADGSATVTILDDDMSTSGSVVYRWNAGNANVSATDDGPDWLHTGLTIVNGPTSIADGRFNVINSLDASVPSTTPIGIYSQVEYKNGNFGLEYGDGTLESGLYAVRLYMGDGYFGTNDPGERLFDVEVEGELFLDDIDLVATLGHQVGGMFEWQGQITDGTLDIDFTKLVDNPLINAVEILRLDGAPPPPPPLAVSVLDATVGEEDGSVTVTFETDQAVPAGEDSCICSCVAPAISRCGAGN